MKETIYNLFAFVNDGIITEVGIAPREYYNPIDTEKDEKTAEEFLARHAGEDLPGAAVYNVPDNYLITDFLSPEDDLTPGMPYRVYQMMAEKGNHEFIGIYENAFEAVSAPLRPFVHYSIVEGNKIIHQHI